MQKCRILLLNGKAKAVGHAVGVYKAYVDNGISTRLLPQLLYSPLSLSPSSFSPSSSFPSPLPLCAVLCQPWLVGAQGQGLTCVVNCVHVEQEHLLGQGRAEGHLRDR